MKRAITTALGTDPQERLKTEDEDEATNSTRRRKRSVGTVKPLGLECLFTYCTLGFPPPLI